MQALWDCCTGGLGLLGHCVRWGRGPCSIPGSPVLAPSLAKTPSGAGCLHRWKSELKLTLG